MTDTAQTQEFSIVASIRKGEDIKKNEDFDAYFKSAKDLKDLDFAQLQKNFSLKKPRYWDSENDFDSVLSTQWDDKGELRLVRMVHILDFKAKELETRGFNDEANSLSDLSGNLKGVLNNYFAEMAKINPTNDETKANKNSSEIWGEKNLIIYEKLSSWNKLINECLNNESLKKHRGYKNVLANIACALLTGVIPYLIYIAYKGQVLNLAKTNTHLILNHLKFHIDDNHGENKTSNFGLFKVEEKQDNQANSSNTVTL